MGDVWLRQSAAGGPLRGTCNPLQPARSTSILAGVGGCLVPTECVRVRLGVFVAPEEAFRESIAGLPSAIHGSPWQPARTPALRRPKSRKGAPRRVFGIPRSDIRRHFRTSKDELRSTVGHRRARQVSDPAALIRVVYNNSFPEVGGSGRRPSRIRLLPRKSAHGAFWRPQLHGRRGSVASREAGYEACGAPGPQYFPQADY